MLGPDWVGVGTVYDVWSYCGRLLLLPALDRGVVHQAVQVLDQIRVVRNAAVHPKPGPELDAAHHALGLSFSVRDFPAAWDSVRAHAERALNNL
ncbi:hypothetical protein OHA84_37570 (plasmid) [Streptomyces sp. NBC_00513]|uniref:hypothetical protein n=1 Tax=unclassified Streptomyces TaxID=2593676 RepID=UPI00225270A5|nr:hypothetical protein [Streptomyces sp. NBC_00424]MCX5078839.1 hypothetical protein [Streptomyces sp. NBC_00424]WUD46241.1 hypothetical protein OHA84_37570 [Streptomyces sp. NBC_00513]